MKSGIVVVICVFSIALIGWVFEGGESPHPARYFPFLSGHPVGLYDFAGLLVLGLFVAGLLRTLENKDGS